MRYSDVVIIGAGQAGLAMSACLSLRRIDHVVLERGQVAERWLSERWDSMRLLTPNWMSRLPGYAYAGPDQEGYMRGREVAGYLAEYARRIEAPVEGGAAVLAVRRACGAYLIETEQRSWRARCVIVATGHCDVAYVPPIAASVPPSIMHVTPARYRNPQSLPDAGVLVVGASATGVQLADEIHRSGRPVSIAVGNHTRVPRTWRARDIMHWLDRAGVLDDGIEMMRDVARARTQPSLQLVGRSDRADLDLSVLHRNGVRLLGRAMGFEGGALLLQDDLADTTAAAESRLDRVLARLDRAADAERAPASVRPDRFLPPRSPAQLDVRAEGIRSIVWATGFRRDYRWLHLPILNGAGEIRHELGVTSSPGLYVLGLHFMRRRSSSFLDGVGADAEALATHLNETLSNKSRLAA